MTIYPLDAVRNGAPDRALEPLLEDIREDILAFPFPESGVGRAEDIVEVFDASRPRLNLIASLLGDRRNGRGADISTGLGLLPVVLARLGCAVTVTERDLELPVYARGHGVEVRPYRIGRMQPPFPAASLDFLVIAEVLEHLKLPPVRTVCELAALLVPGGTFVLTTPNVARLAHLEALAAGENFLEPFDESIADGGDPTDFLEHVREYSIREVVEAVEAAGLGVDRVLMTGWGEAGYEPLPNPYANEIIVVVASA